MLFIAAWPVAYCSTLVLSVSLRACMLIPPFMPPTVSPSSPIAPNHRWQAVVSKAPIRRARYAHMHRFGIHAFKDFQYMTLVNYIIILFPIRFHSPSGALLWFQTSMAPCRSFLCGPSHSQILHITQVCAALYGSLSSGYVNTSSLPQNGHGFNSSGIVPPLHAGNSLAK